MGREHPMLKLFNWQSIITHGQSLIERLVVDVFGKEPHGTIPHQHVQSPLVHAAHGLSDICEVIICGVVEIDPEVRVGQCPVGIASIVSGPHTQPGGSTERLASSGRTAIPFPHKQRI